MALEFFLTLFLLWYYRRALRHFSPQPDLEKKLRQGMFVALGIFLLELVFKIEPLTRWLWFGILLSVLVVMYRRRDLLPVRTAIYAVLPYLVLNVFVEAVLAVRYDWYEALNDYTQFVTPVSFTWMLALLIISGRQQKALVKEHKLRLAEEEQRRQIAARKAELEKLVTERTAELTLQKEELQNALAHLEATQAQLIQREKMASLGELTAGIAHEIQNPLNFVNNFSEVSIELADELAQEINAAALSAEDKERLRQLLFNLSQSQQKIVQHGKRADGIVKGMLMHSRISTGHKEPTDLNALADEYLRLSYHGLRAKDKSFNATLHTHFDEAIGRINIVPQDIGRVVLNLCNNAFYSVSEKKKKLNGYYEPTVAVSTKKEQDKVLIKVKDNGVGIPPQVVDKIYQPFFTTKPTGQGTGLGLSLTYDIVTKVHGGGLTVATKEGEYAEFVIKLPMEKDEQTAAKKVAFVPGKL